MQFQKILSFLGCLLVGCLIFYITQNFTIKQTDFYSYAWLTSRYYPVNIDFYTNLETYKFLLLFIIVVFLNAFNTIWDSSERQKTHVFAISLINLALLIMLMCGKNTIQILVSVCFIDVLGFYLINNISERRRYIFYNLFEK